MYVCVIYDIDQFKLSVPSQIAMHLGLNWD